VALGVALLTLLFPVYWVVSSSLKTPAEVFTQPVQWVPSRFLTTNYVQAFTTLGGLKAIVNSLIVAGGGTALALAVGYPAAYYASRFRRGRVAVFLLPAILRLSPPIVFALPLLVFYSSIGVVDTVYALALVYGATTAFYVIWMVKPFIDVVPLDVEDMATVDGEARWRVPFTVVLPLVVGGVAAAALFVFLLNWTEFLLALALTRFEARTVPVAMTVISALGAVSSNWGPIAALSTVSLIPFLFGTYYLQRQLLRAFALTFGRR
jgi:multiple sugar transport system permease protein